jgi:hypothetical protein
VPDESIVVSFPLRLLDAHKSHTPPPQR